MTPEQFDDLAALGTVRTFRRGRILVREGEELGRVYVLLSGQVKVIRTTLDGTEVLLALRSGPTVIGELSAFDGRPASATVEVIEPVDAAAVTTRAFLAHLEAHPGIMLQQLRRLATTVRESDVRRIHLATLDLTSRLARALLEASANGTVSLSQDELASMCGATREAVARVLRVFRTDGWVRTERRRIEVVDRSSLQELAGVDPLIV